MAYSYEKNIVPVVQNLLGGMYDFAVYGLDYTLNNIHNLFLDSIYCRRVETADSCTVMGKSGIELCYDITEHDRISEEKMNKYTTFAISGRSKEYWTGWALSYYQWATALSFHEIDAFRNIDEVSSMYNICHEMDIRHFVDRMNQAYKSQNPDSRLKQVRTSVGLSQKNLSDLTNIPLKTIQQYEQRQKNINNASVDYVIRLSRALNCDVELLLEIEP